MTGPGRSGRPTRVEVLVDGSAVRASWVFDSVGLRPSLRQELLLVGSLPPGPFLRASTLSRDRGASLTRPGVRA